VIRQLAKTLDLGRHELLGEHSLSTPTRSIISRAELGTNGTGHPMVQA
jgi:hypothetical protein